MPIGHCAHGLLSGLKLFVLLKRRFLAPCEGYKTVPVFCHVQWFNLLIIIAGYNSSYFCAKQSTCEIRLKTRKSCQYCRYQRCLDAGMKASWVITDEERKQKLSKMTNNNNPSPSSSSPSDDADEALEYKPSLSEADFKLMDDLVEKSLFFKRSKVDDLDIHLARQIVRLVHLDNESLNAH